MNYSISFLEPAEVELIDTVKYYNEQSQGLGFEFAFEIKRTLSVIIDFPLAYTKFSKDTRKCRCSRFPFYIIYSIMDSEIIVVAIMHSKRKPNYWKDRL